MELVLPVVLVLVAAVAAIWLVRFLVRHRAAAAMVDQSGKAGADAAFDSLKSLSLVQEPSPVSLRERLEFYSIGHDRGFSFRELRSLLYLVRLLGLEHPSGLLGSSKVLDHYLTRLMEKQWRQVLQDQSFLQDLVLKLLDYRMGQEKSRPRRQKGLDSTRTLSEGQVVKLLFKEKNLLMGKVCDVGRSFLRIQVVQGKIPAGTSFKGQRVEVWFWRSDDAMYQFESVILAEPEKNALYPPLTIRHADSLQRQQKREHLRARVLRDGEIIPLPGIEQANETWQPGQGYPCRVLDISETGAAIIVRGKVVPGVLAKIQLPVDDGALVMCGEIRSTDLKPVHGVSILHMEALPLSRWMRSLVMAYVLGLLRHGTDPAPQKLSASDAEVELGPGNLPGFLADDALPGQGNKAPATEASTDPQIPEEGGL